MKVLQILVCTITVDYIYRQENDPRFQKYHSQQWGAFPQIQSVIYEPFWMPFIDIDHIYFQELKWFSNEKYCVEYISWAH